MTITDTTIQVERPESYAPRRMPARSMIAIGATTLVAAVVALAAVVAQNGDDDAVRPRVQVATAVRPTSQSGYDVVRDLVNRGMIPRQSLPPATQSGDDVVRDLVNRGLIPRQSLPPAPRSQDDAVRDLVDRGLVPAASLDD